jgi:hypothetical protein
VLTRTAYAILRRVAGGKPAFKSMLPPVKNRSSKWKWIERNRREALDDLYRFRYMRRTKRGPEITPAGQKALIQIEQIRLGGKWNADVVGMTQENAAERYGMCESTLSSRTVRLLEAAE